MRRPMIALVLATWLLASLPVGASDITVGGATLPGGLNVYEVNLGQDGKLYVADLYGAQIWRVDPMTGEYVRFHSAALGMPQDARADSDGNIWYTDWGSFSIGRISAGEDPQLTTWDLSLWDLDRYYNLAGTAIDQNGWLWFSEYGEEADQLLYRLDPSTEANELCGYTLPGSGDHSYYPLSSGGFIWLGDWVQGLIVRFDPSSSSSNTTYWSVGKTEPRGLAIDATDSIWWADTKSHTIQRLELSGANANRVTTYTLKVAGTPYMVAVVDGRLWYTAQDVPAGKASLRTAAPAAGSGTMGVLDPGVASGTLGKEISPQTVTSTAECHELGAGTRASMTTTSGTLSWVSNVWTDITPAGVTGWTIYDATGYPYGIVGQSDNVWVTDQWWQRLVRISLGGLPAPQVTLRIPPATTNVELTWYTVDGADQYRTWYSSTDPYFTPGGTPALDPDPTDLAFTHTGAAGSTSPNYYYVVVAVDGDGVESADSNRTGKFSFTLTRGQ